MSWMPGWDSIADAGWWSSFYFWVGIVALLALGISEVVSHRYGDRKDELVSEQQAATEHAHNEEMARVHLETAQANERAALLEKEAAQLRLDLAKIKEPRFISVEARNRIADKMKEFAGQEFFGSIASDVSDAWDVWREISLSLELAGWKWKWPLPPFAERLGVPVGIARAPLEGVVIRYSSFRLRELKPRADMLAKALTDEGIIAGGGVGTIPANMPDALEIEIGPKPQK